MSMLQPLSNNVFKFLVPFVTSSFQLHSLTATTTIISSLTAGLTMLPFSKLIDTWGRPQGLTIMLILETIGIIMMAVCKNVETYCAAQVFYNVGYSGIQLIFIVFVADTSTMQNRALMIAGTTSSMLGIVWAFSPVTNSIILHTGLPWGFGIFAIVTPIVCAPLIVMLFYYQHKAMKQGLLQRVSSGRTPMQSILHYARELDIIGLLLLAAGLALILLALSLYSYQQEQWRSPMIISFLVIGPLSLGAFVLYEWCFASVGFIEWELLRKPTVPFAFILALTVFCGSYIWLAYLVSALLIVWNLSIPTALNVGNIIVVGGVFSQIAVGITLHFYGRFKWVALYVSMPLLFLGAGLMIQFRHYYDGIGYIAMCLVFISLGLGSVALCEQIALMSVATQQQIAALIATSELVSSIGVSTGSAISAAIWTAVFPEKLEEYLPADARYLAPSIYGSLVSQMSYPKGSPIRTGIDLAYSASLRIMLIAAICFYVLSFASVLFWKNLDARKIIQVRGRVV